MFKIILLIIITLNLYSFDKKIFGRITGFSPKGEEYPLEVKIKDLMSGATTNSDKKGFFELKLNKNISAGTKIRLSIDEEGKAKWFIHIPYKGEFFLPKNLEDFTLHIRAVGNESVVKSDLITYTTNIKGQTEKPKFTIQIISLKSYYKAKRILNYFKSRKYSAKIKKINSEYKIWISEFEDKEKAKIVLRQIKKNYPKYDDAYIRYK